MPDPIRAIVRTLSSARDINGNCYHLCYIYDVRQGIHTYLTIETNGPSNGGGLVQRALSADPYTSVLCTEEVLPYRLWKSKRKYAQGGLYEHEAEAAVRKFFKVREPKAEGKPC